MEFMLVGIGLMVLIGGPILAISALIQVARMAQRIGALEQQLAQLQGRPPQAPERPVQPAQPLPAAPPRRPVAAPAPAAPAAPQESLESLIAGRWLNRVGLLLVFLAAFFALKWEFDNDLLGPTGRVALWTLIGAGLLVYAQWLLLRGYKYLSEGLTGLGGAVLYLTLYFAWSYFKLFPQAVAFVAMILVTAALLGIAIGRDSQRVALLALLGGFLTPLLTSTGQDAQVVLFSYLLILDAGLLVLARARTWRGLEPPAFVFSIAFFWGWYGSFYDVSQPLLRTTAFATLFFAVFAALPVIRARATGRVFPEQVAQMLLNAGNYLLALHAMLWPDHRWALTAAVLALAALHVTLTHALPRVPGETPVARMLFAGLALTFVTLAIPIRLTEHWITIAWAVEGAVLVWSGFNARWWFLRAAGCTLYAVAVLRLLTVPPHAEAFLFNARFATFAVVIAALASALYLWRRQPVELKDAERGVFAAMGVAVNGLAVLALSLEADQYFQPLLAGDADAVRSAELGRQVALSLLWTAYATGLVVIGVRRAVPGIRWQGLVLFGLVVGKVFLYDLSFLGGGHRILSSIVLGIVLIAISVLYQRSVAASKAAVTLVAALLLTAYAPQNDVALPAPWEHWRYSAPVRVPRLNERRLVRVLVPESVSRKALPLWTDLRVIDDSAREVPFVLHARVERRSREARQARLMDLTHKPGEDTRATVDLGAQSSVHNEIEIQTSSQDFFARVAIDAGADGKDWHIVESGTPIYRFANDGLDGNQTVRYTDNASRYLRLRITDGPDRFPLTGVRVWHEVKVDAELVPAELPVPPAAGAPPGESWWVADAAGQPLSQVAFALERTTFHRPVRIRASDDGTTWRSIGSGDIYRIEGREGVREQLQVGFAESRARLLRVEVVNRNDAPLAGVTPRLYATPRRVVFTAEPGRGYRLLYGNPRAPAADYEMARVTPVAALEAAPAAELGSEVVNAAYVDPAPWSERHPAVLWAALVAALAVLGGLAIRALKSSTPT
jgi:hypothetical protein